MVKRFILFFTIVLILAGCADFVQLLDSDNNNNKEETSVEESNNSEDESNNVETDGALDKEVFLPASLFHDRLNDFNQAEIRAKNNGAEDVHRDDEGNITYKISSSAHQKMLEEYEDLLFEKFDELEGETAPSISTITYDELFTEFTIEVDSEIYEDTLDYALIIHLGGLGLRQQIFTGADPETYGTHMSVIDEDTGDLIIEYDLPDMFSDLDEQ